MKISMDFFDFKLNQRQLSPRHLNRCLTEGCTPKVIKTRHQTFVLIFAKYIHSSQNYFTVILSRNCPIRKLLKIQRNLDVIRYMT